MSRLAEGAPETAGTQALPRAAAPERVAIVTSARSAFATELGFALEVAARAGELVMAGYERDQRIRRKGPRDIVTEVDGASERLIIDAIRAAFPGDAILAEETGAHAGAPSDPAPADLPPDGSARSVPARRVWVVDPLDGTINYANGIPFFCVSIGLVVDGRPSVGVVLDPIRGEPFAATVDGPATLAGRPIACSTKERLADVVIALSLSGRAATRRARAVRRQVRSARTLGAAALEIAYVARGRFDAFAVSAGMSAWDVAAAGLIAERAGAVVTSPTGGPWLDLAAASRSVGLLAAPAAHHASLLELIREPASMGRAPANARPGA
jgi:fructose-1,6-bisphosphatase/inositol monophosphatase family enzyme